MSGVDDFHLEIISQVDIYENQIETFYVVWKLCIYSEP
jgi:hypothetical protein